MCLLSLGGLLSGHTHFSQWWTLGSQISVTPCVTLKIADPPPLTLCSTALLWCSVRPNLSRYPKTTSDYTIASKENKLACTDISSGENLCLAHSRTGMSGLIPFPPTQMMFYCTSVLALRKWKQATAKLTEVSPAQTQCKHVQSHSWPVAAARGCRLLQALQGKKPLCIFSTWPFLLLL